MQAVHRPVNMDLGKVERIGNMYMKTGQPCSGMMKTALNNVVLPTLSTLNSVLGPPTLFNVVNNSKQCCRA